MFHQIFHGYEIPSVTPSAASYTASNINYKEIHTLMIYKFLQEDKNTQFILGTVHVSPNAKCTYTRSM